VWLLSVIADISRYLDGVSYFNFLIDILFFRWLCPRFERKSRSSVYTRVSWIL